MSRTDSRVAFREDPHSSSGLKYLLRTASSGYRVRCSLRTGSQAELRACIDGLVANSSHNNLFTH